MRLRRSYLEEPSAAVVEAACCVRATVLIEEKMALARRKVARARELPPKRRRKMAETACKLNMAFESVFDVLPGLKDGKLGLLARWQAVQAEVDALLAECGVAR